MTDPADTDLDDLLRTLPRAEVAAWCVATIERLVRRCPMAADWERYVPDPGWVDAQLDANPEFALILRKDAIRVAAMGKSGDDRIDAERAERDAQTNTWISGAHPVGSDDRAAAEGRGSVGASGTDGVAQR